MRAPGYGFLACSTGLGILVASERVRHRFILRLPVDLHRRVADASARYGRSINSEIVCRLDHSLRGLSEDESSVEPPLMPFIEMTFRGELTGDENQLVRRFRQLSEQQRTALLKLLAG